MKRFISNTLTLVFVIALNAGCDEQDDSVHGLRNYDLPITHVVTTKDATNITCTTAECSGCAFVIGANPNKFTVRGICWSLISNPTVNNNVIIANDSTSSNFAINLTGLIPNTKYFFRAFAKNAIGTIYGSIKNFMTLPTSPIVYTSFVLDFTSTTAIFGGDVQSEGLTSVIENGVYWGLNSNPELTGIRLKIESGAGPFSAKVSELVPNTTYYVKAYAENTLSKAFGITYSFNTGQNSSYPLVLIVIVIIILVLVHKYGWLRTLRQPDSMIVHQ
ncbi:MAG: hypothetical protein AB9846_17685 [Tenuifilaceae bacterium]